MISGRAEIMRKTRMLRDRMKAIQRRRILEADIGRRLASPVFRCSGSLCLSRWRMQSTVCTRSRENEVMNMASTNHVRPL